MLKLGWQPSEISLGLGDTKGLQAWRDLFLGELKQRFLGDNDKRRKALKNAFDSLDRGKRFVFDGSDWLEEQLFG